MEAAELVARARTMLDRPTFYVAGAGGRISPDQSAEDAATLEHPMQRLSEMSENEREEYERMIALTRIDTSKPLRACDCSGFVCWAYGLDRSRSAPDGRYINTDWMWSDARGPQRLFRRIDSAAEPLRAAIGSVLVYPKTPGVGERYGHVALVTQTDANGRPTRVIHCSAENFKRSYAALGDATRANAIAETGPEVFFEHLAVPGYEAIAAECIGVML